MSDSFSREAPTAIAQNTSAYFYCPNMATVAIDASAISSGTYKLYGAQDYDPSMPDKTTAHWVPIPTTDTAGVEVAANTAITPSTTKTVFASVATYRGIRITEQNAGTLTAWVACTQIPISDVLSSVALAVSADTELPAAALLADNTATPTAPAVGAFGMVYDGSTWDMLRGTAADGMLVNLGTNNDVDTELPAAAALGDNTANPTAPAVGAFGHVWDGSTWDRTPGTAADGVTVNLGTNNDVSLNAGTNLVGATAPACRVVDITFTLPTATLTAGDVMAEFQDIALATRANDAPTYLVGFQWLDKDDQAAADTEFYFSNSATASLGTEDSAVSISDADAATIMHVIKIDDTEVVDIINSKIATKGASKDGGPWLMIPCSGTRTIRVGTVTRGTPTTTASGQTARFYFQDVVLGA